MLVTERGNFIQFCDFAVHAEHSISNNQTPSESYGIPQHLLQLCHVAVLVAKSLGLAEPHAVNNRGVIEFIGENGVAFAEKYFKKSGVRIKAGSIENCVLGSKEL